MHPCQRVFKSPCGIEPWLGRVRECWGSGKRKGEGEGKFRLYLSKQISEVSDTDIIPVYANRSKVQNLSTLHSHAALPKTVRSYVFHDLNEMPHSL